MDEGVVDSSPQSWGVRGAGSDRLRDNNEIATNMDPIRRMGSMFVLVYVGQFAWPTALSSWVPTQLTRSYPGQITHFPYRKLSDQSTGKYGCDLCLRSAIVSRDPYPLQSTHLWEPFIRTIYESTAKTYQTAEDAEIAEDSPRKRLSFLCDLCGEKKLFAAGSSMQWPTPLSTQPADLASTSLILRRSDGIKPWKCLTVPF